MDVSMLYILILILVVLFLFKQTGGSFNVSRYEQGFLDYLDDLYPDNISKVHNGTRPIEKDTLEYFVVLPDNVLYLVTVRKESRNTYTHDELTVAADDTYLRDVFRSNMKN